MAARERDALKREHERAVGDDLLKGLKIEAAFDRLGDDKKEPDVIYKLKDKTLGVEIATAYYDESDAEQAWTLVAGERQLPKEGYELRAKGVLVNPDATICKKVQAELDDKCQKKYEGTDEVWLCVVLEAPLSDRQSVTKCAENLKVTDGHGFAAIYIAYRAPANEGGEFTALQIQ